MSHYETPEQREIRELRSQISLMNYTVDIRNRENEKLRRQIEVVRGQQAAENERMMRQMSLQQQKFEQQKSQKESTMSAELQALNREVRERERLQNEKIASIREQHEARVRDMNARFKKETDGIRGDLRDLRDENQRNQKEIQRTQAEMRSRLAEIRQETERKLREQKDELHRTIDMVSTRLEGKILSVDGKVQTLMNQLSAKESSARELAQYWVQEAERLMRSLKETYRSSLFNEKRVRRLEQDLRDAARDIETGHYDSAIKTGRDAFRDGMEMKEELAVAELEWNYAYNSLRNRESRLLEDLDSAGHRIYSVDTEEGTITYSNGIDYWTNGQLSVTEERVRKLREKMGDLQDASMEELGEYEREIISLTEELALVENASHTNVAMSLSRYRTAVKIGEILGKEFHMLDADGDFYGEENRDEYHAVYVNSVTGDSVVAVITPVPDESGVVSNHIELIAGNGMDNDLRNRHMIHRKVTEKLRESGIREIDLERCADRHGADVRQVIARAGNIAAVAAGDENVRIGVPGRGEQEDLIGSVRRG